MIFPRTRSGHPRPDGDIGNGAAVAHQIPRSRALQLGLQRPVETARLGIVPVDAVLDLLGSVTCFVVRRAESHPALEGAGHRRLPRTYVGSGSAVYRYCKTYQSGKNVYTMTIPYPSSSFATVKMRSLKVHLPLEGTEAAHLPHKLRGEDG